jgi:predicted RNA-binding Zn-ribbon protein involved in translation (DUF1610 family)
VLSPSRSLRYARSSDLERVSSVLWELSEDERLADAAERRLSRINVELERRNGRLLPWLLGALGWFGLVTIRSQIRQELAVQRFYPRRPPTRCVECSYSLVGLDGPAHVVICPECGAATLGRHDRHAVMNIPCAGPVRTPAAG